MNLVVAFFRNFLNNCRLYRDLRSVVRVGLVRSLRWRWRLRQILRAPAVSIRPWEQDGAPCEFRIMTSGADWMLALWAAWSFYRCAGVDWPLIIHDGGGLSQSIRFKMSRLFPTARFIGWEEANNEVEDYLSRKRFHYLLEARRRNVMIRKLVDFAIIGKSRCFISCDSDVLFFTRPDQLLDLAEGNGLPFGFNRDSHTMYSIETWQAMEWFGLILPKKINAGLGLLTRREVDLAFLNQIFAPGRIPPDKDAFPEQTACALLVARTGGNGFLSNGYSVATGTPPLNLEEIGAVSRHYVGPVRNLFFDEGLPVLIKHLGKNK